jgi:hypothetical protein
MRCALRPDRIADTTRTWRPRRRESARMRRSRCSETLDRSSSTCTSAHTSIRRRFDCRRRRSRDSARPTSSSCRRCNPVGARSHTPVLRRGRRTTDCRSSRPGCGRCHRSCRRRRGRCTREPREGVVPCTRPATITPIRRIAIFASWRSPPRICEATRRSNYAPTELDDRATHSWRARPGVMPVHRLNAF